MAMNATSVREDDPVSEINITPLIDVMLVLLVMLIVILPPQVQVTKLDTPLPSKPPPIAPPQPIRIAIDYDGTTSWNGDVIDRAELDVRLKAEFLRVPQMEIHIEPHRLTRYEHVIHVMASAQRNGLTRLGVMGGT